IELTQNHIYLPVQLAAGRTSWFVLDTGADATAIDAGHAKELGLAGSGGLEASGTGESTIEAQLIAKPPLRIAGLQMPLDTMYAVSIRAIWPRGGRAMEGILGHDVLSHFVVEIDYAASRVRLHDPERFTAPTGATAFPFTYEGNVPAIRAGFELPGGRRVEGRMIVDTGNSGGIDLYGPFIEANGVRAAIGRTIEGAGGMGVGGVAKQDVGRIAAFHLGPFALKSPIVTLSRDAKGSAAHPELAGNLGGRVLRRFRVFVDYANDRILLEPNKTLHEPFEYDMSGLALVAEGEQFERMLVRRVQPETPGAAAGFRDGDQILTINGRKVTLQEARKLFAAAGKKYKVRVRRGTGDVTLKLTTRRMI
ncbi:MAG TPA: aspartyl protease family protein, partial [Thermoanaerobaculia bacterium]|nr:aspartyl protease family protein [Thermoanaerobaculia bacterium]